MFLLMRGIVHRLWRESLSKNICLLGLDSAGKTCLLNHWRHKRELVGAVPPDQIVPTVGQNIAKFDAGGVHWNVWDVGGSERFREEVWQDYFPEIDVIVFVLDSSDDRRLEEARRCLSDLTSAPELAHAPICVMANKQDKKSARGVEAIEKDLGLKKIVKGRESTIVPSMFAGEFEKHEGFDKMEEWVLSLNDSIDSVRQRSELRRSFAQEAAGSP